MAATAKIGPSWSNWIGDLGANADRYGAEDKDALVSVLERAVRDGKRIRAVGSGHSMSACARPRERFVVLGEGLSGAFAQVKWLKRDPPGVARGERLVRVRAGTRIKVLNRIVLAGMRPEAALLNMGTFDGQTLAGAISTGTHGSGMALGGLADCVVSVDMATVTKSGDGTPQVQMRRFEPAEGVTDRALFNADKGEHGMVLEQDDETFHSVVVGFGCLGLVHSYILKVRDAYWLREESSLMEWPALRAQLSDPIVTEPGLGKRVPKFAAEDRHFQLLVNVAEAQGKKAREDIACLVVRRNIAKAEDRPRERRNPFFRNLFKGLLGGIAAPRAHQDNDGFGRTMRNQYFEKEAKEEPFVNNRTATASYICLKRERDTSADDKPPDPPDHAISVELAVPAEHVALAVDTVLDAIRDQDWFFAVPLGVRFGGPSPHYLASNYGRSTAWVEVPFLQIRARKDGQGLSPGETTDRIAKPALARIERLVKQHPQLQGRPHLGKYNTVTYDELKQQYPRFEVWEATFRRFNQFGTFENGFTDQLGLSSLR